MEKSRPKPINWDDYFQKLITIQIQFETARMALKGFGENPDTLKGFAEKQLKEIRDIVHEGAQQKGVDPLGTWVHDEEHVAKYLEAAREDATRTLVDAGGRLKQYEYILRVTIFESLMKDIHRAILEDQPTLLREDRQVPLGKLLAKGQDEVLREEIEREVQMLDRKSVEDKADYFFKRLGINWLGGTIVPFLDHAVRVRNEMLHENPDRMVNEEDLFFLNLATFSVPIATLAQAALLYPRSFTPPMNIAEEDARKFFLDAIRKSNSPSPTTGE